jgi:hypothetical protein
MYQAPARSRAAARAGPTIVHHNPQERHMAKGEQRSNKESKKPKKDSSPGKPISAGAVSPTITTVVPDRSKKKK